MASANASSDYRFADANTAGYYRLKLADRNGRFTHSKVLLFIPGKDKETFNIYPTAFTGTQPTTAQFSSTNNRVGTVQWITAEGKVLQQYSQRVEAGANIFWLHPQAAWPVGKLPVVCTGAEEVKTISLLKF